MSGPEISDDLKRLAGDGPVIHQAEPPPGSKLPDAALAQIKAFAGQGAVTARDLRQSSFTTTFDPPLRQVEPERDQ